MSVTFELSNQRCLVLGGSGFIGSNLCQALREKALSVRAFSRSALAVKGVEWLPGDFLNEDDISLALRDVDIVFHLICTTVPASSNDYVLADAEQNIVQTLKLLEACRTHGVKRVIFASSGGTVYGEATQLPTPETHPERPICGYGISKLAIEKYLALYERMHGIVGISLRVANPYGPFQSSLKKRQGVIGAFLTRALANEPVQIWGDGSVVRDYVYIEDVVDALLKAAQYTGPARLFNIGSGTGVSLNQIVESIEEILGVHMDKRFKSARSVDIAINVLDSSLAKAELGWETRHDLREGIKKTANWYKSAQFSADSESASVNDGDSPDKNGR